MSTIHDDDQTTDDQLPDAEKMVEDADDGSSDQGTDHAGGADKVVDDLSATEDTTTDEDADTFDRAYVEDLRKESAGYRTQLREVQEQLHRALVEKSGRLADPADLAFDPAHLDGENLAAAIDALLEAKPHLKARRFDSDAAAQGAKQGGVGQVNLAELMRSRL